MIDRSEGIEIVVGGCRGRLRDRMTVRPAQSTGLNAATARGLPARSVNVEFAGVAKST